MRIDYLGGHVTANQVKVRTIGRECRLEGRRRQRPRQGRLGPGAASPRLSSAQGGAASTAERDAPHSAIKVDRGGGAVFWSTDIGQGSDSVLAYVVAEELGILPEDIRVVTADTDLTPVDLGSYSSRVTLMTGNAAIQAARRVREPILAAAAKKLDVPVGRLRAAGRRIFDAGDPARSLGFAEAVVLAESASGTLGAVGSYSPPRSVAKWRARGGPADVTYSLRGEPPRIRDGTIRIDGDGSRDVGRSINPLLVIGQSKARVHGPGER